jgi:uncharacterized protein (TIGR03492 family)
VFPRDHLTSERLQQWPIPVFDVGNPMMDYLEPQGKLPLQRLEVNSTLKILLLPGSRPPEAYANWALLLVAISGLLLSFESSPREGLLFLGAIAPSLDLQAFHPALYTHGWHRQPEKQMTTAATLQTFTQAQTTLLLTQGAFNDCVHLADLAIAMAGTATEQCVGLGKPVITVPGRGPQFTAAFAKAQARFLGPSVTPVTQPHQVPAAIQNLSLQPERQRAWQHNGLLRMGEPGAAGRIAAWLQQELLQQ